MINYLRVSDIIAPFSGVEFVPEQYLLPAAERGTKVHTYVESILKGKDIFIFEEELRPYVEAFELFWSKYIQTVKDAALDLERRFYCEEKKITGQIDAIFAVDDKIYICDWKTSLKKSVSWDLQGAAYRYLLEVNGYTNVDSVLFVQLKKDGTFKTYKCEDHHKHLEIFFKCLELYNYFNMSKTRKKILEDL